MITKIKDYDYDLGEFSWKVDTSAPEAQHWFNRGVQWCYAFHHEEAVACFENALEHDRDFAMAHWGIAYALGPNYNKPWALFDPVDKAQSLSRAFDATERARSLATPDNPLECVLIEALAARYPQRDPIADHCSWDDAYTAAMRRVFEAYKGDLNVRALFAEAIMDRTPWQMWDLRSGEPAEGAGTLEALEVLEGSFRDFPKASEHGGLLHLYIHLMEMSPFPERALRAADRLRELSRDAAHFIHMPTHIDLLCGHYENVALWNEKAIEADDKYLAREGAMNFYTFYRVHNYHFAAYGSMFLGQYSRAMDAAQAMIDTIPEPLLRIESPPMADYLEGYIPMKQHVLIRFGKWHEILEQALPEDQELYVATTAMLHYAKGVAHSALGQLQQAEQEQRLFHKAKMRLPDSRRVHNNKCKDLLEIASEMLAGELEYRRGHYDKAFGHLRRSVELDDGLPYDEPWGWMQPTRHALGALLLEQGHLAEAESVYRADLGLDDTLSRACQHPDNLWSLHGLHECLTRRRDEKEAPLVKQRLDLANARADMPVKASCFCRLSAIA